MDSSLKRSGSRDGCILAPPGSIACRLVCFGLALAVLTFSGLAGLYMLGAQMWASQSQVPHRDHVVEVWIMSQRSRTPRKHERPCLTPTCSFQK